MPKNKKIALEWKKKYGDNNFKPKIIFSKQDTKDSLIIFSKFFYHGNGLKFYLINPLKIKLE